MSSVTSLRNKRRSSFAVCVGAVTVVAHMQKGLGSNPGIARFLVECEL